MSKTIKDYLNENWDYVSYRIALGNWAEKEHIGADAIANSTFAGCFAVKKGKIIPLDGDEYGENETVLYAEKWNNPHKRIKKGLTVVVSGAWM